MKFKIFELLLITSLSVLSCTGDTSVNLGDDQGSGAATDPKISVKKDSSIVYSGGSAVPFGNIAAGQSSTPVTFTIENSGGGELNISSISINGPDSADFNHDFAAATVLNAGKTLDVDVTFSPPAIETDGSKFAQINITHNDLGGRDNPYIIQLTGIVVLDVPEINIKDSMSHNILSGSEKVHFGAIVAGTNTSQIFTVENIGSANLTLTGGAPVTLSDNINFSVTAQPLPVSPVPPSGNAVFTIQFNPPPANAGYHTATVTVANNDIDEGVYTFTVTGQADAVPAPEINVRVGGSNLPDDDNDALPYVYNSYDFGELNADGNNGNTTVYETFTINNAGSGPLDVTGVSLSAGDTGDFDLDPTGLTSPVPSGGSTSFRVRFDPLSVNLKDTLVSISSNDVSEATYTFGIQGTGILPEVKVSPDDYNFGNFDAASSSSAIPFTVTNTGNTNLNNVAVAGGDLNFTLDNSNFPANLAPGEQKTFNVTYNAIEGTANPTINFNITTNEGASDILTVEGTCVENDSVTVSPDNYNFGNVNAASSSSAIPFTVTNTGNTNLNNVAVAGGDLNFTLDNSNFPANLAPGEQKTFNVTYNAIEGTANPTINFNITTNEGASDILTVEGTCVENATGIKTVDTTGVSNHTSMAVVGNKTYIAYYKDNELHFAYSTDGGATWNTEIVDNSVADVGQYPSIAAYSDRGLTGAGIADNFDDIYICYYDASTNNGNLKFAKLHADINSSSSHDVNDWFLGIVDNNVNNVGQYSSISVLFEPGNDGADRIYASYNDATDTSLKFAYSTNGGVTWNIDEIDNSANVGQYTSIIAYPDRGLAGTGSVDNFDDIYISYYDTTTNNGNQKFAKLYADLNLPINHDASDWILGNADNNIINNVGQYSSMTITFDPADQNEDKLYISYHDATAQELKIAISNDGSATWNSKTVDTLNDVGTYSSLALYANTLNISYYDAHDHNLKFARSTDLGATWSLIKNVDDDTNVGIGACIKLTSGDVISISYIDAALGNLKLAKSADGGATWE